MKKLFTLMALLALALSANAQRITFDEGKKDSWDVDGFKLEYVDENSKIAVDANNCYFGTADSYEKFESRLKTGGKSQSSNSITLTIPSAGTLKVYARTGSNSATDRNVVLTQNGETLFDAIVQESDALEVPMPSESDPDKTTKVYPIISVPVQAGKVEVGYPTGSINFYCFELEAGGAGAPTSYDVTIVSDPENDYYSGYQAFDPTKIATALGLDASALDEFIDGNGTANVYIKDGDGMSNNYTGNHNEFWMNASGVAQGYGDEGSCWYIGLSYDDGIQEEGENTDPEVDIIVGQMPNYFKNIYTDSDLHTTIYLVNGEKVITFNVTLHVNAAPEPNLPEPVTKLNELTIVKDYDFTLPFTTGKEYENKTYTATLDGIYDALGVSQTDLDAFASDVTFAQIVNTTTENDLESYELSDDVVRPEDASGGGWFGRYVNFDEGTGKETVLPINAPLAWGGKGECKSTFYIQSVTLAEGEFSFVSGQYPGTFKAGDSDYTYLYLIVGNKAARVKVQVEVKDPEVIDPNDMTMVGETTVNISAEVNDSYGTKSFTVDIAPILEALELESYDEDIYSWASEGVMDNNHTEGSGGFYWNDEGYIQSWGSNASFYVALGSIANGQYYIGQMAGHFTNITEPTTVSADILYVNGNKYYAVHVVYTVTPSSSNTENPDDAFEIVSRQALDMEIIPADQYYGDMDAEGKALMELQLDMDEVALLIGSGSYDFYGLKAPTDANSYPKLATSTGYTPNSGFSGGFWMSMPNTDLGEEYIVTSWVGSWGTNAYGIEWNLSTGVIGFDQIPSQRAVGDSYRSTFYLVNSDNNKAIKYTLNVTYVEAKSANVEQVGASTNIIICSDDNLNSDGLYQGVIDWETVCSLLEIDESEIADCTWMITSATGKLVPYNGSFEGEDVAFDAGGYYVDVLTNPQDAVFSVGYDRDSKMFTVSLLGNEPEDGVLYSTVVGLMSSTGYHKFTIYAGTESTLTSISSITSDSTMGKVFDLSGRRVAVPTKGLYIINGKKVLVK